MHWNTTLTGVVSAVVVAGGAYMTAHCPGLDYAQLLTTALLAGVAAAVNLHRAKPQP